MLKVINGAELKGNVFMNQNESEIFGVHERKTEYEYRQLLLAAQKYFSYVASNKIDPSIEYNIVIINSTGRDIVDAKFLFVDKSIQVKKVENGYEYCGYDGRHRYYIAQKYGLNLLVDVVEDVTSNQKRNLSQIFKKPAK